MGGTTPGREPAWSGGRTPLPMAGGRTPAWGAGAASARSTFPIHPSPLNSTNISSTRLVRQRLNSPHPNVAPRRLQYQHQRRLPHTSLHVLNRRFPHRKPLRRRLPNRKPLRRRPLRRRPHPSLEPNSNILLLLPRSLRLLHHQHQHHQPNRQPHSRLRTLLPHPRPLLPNPQCHRTRKQQPPLRRAYTRKRFHNGAYACCAA